MENNFWESEELESSGVTDSLDSLDLDEEGVTESEVAPPETLSVAQELSEEEDDSELLTNARLRLEQGKLYEMLLKHDLFGNVDADRRAIVNVQREIRSFIKERLEILLGLKPDPKLMPAQQEVRVVESSQFSDFEVMLLKRLLVKLSKGATEQVDPVKVSQSAPLKPVSAQPSGSLSQVGGQKKQQVVRTAMSSKPAKEPPSQVVAPNETIKKILEEQFGENEMPLGKPAHKMKRSELLERNRRISQRQAARKSSGPGRVAALSPDQEAAIMMQHVMARNESLQASGANPLSLAVSKVIADKAQQSE